MGNAECGMRIAEYGLARNELVASLGAYIDAVYGTNVP